MQLYSVFFKSPVNVLAYFNNLKKRKNKKNSTDEHICEAKEHTGIENKCVDASGGKGMGGTGSLGLTSAYSGYCA